MFLTGLIVGTFIGGTLGAFFMALFKAQKP
jgi:hypothetical protein